MDNSEGDFLYHNFTARQVHFLLSFRFLRLENLIWLLFYEIELSSTRPLSRSDRASGSALSSVPSAFSDCRYRVSLGVAEQDTDSTSSRSKSISIHWSFLAFSLDLELILSRPSLVISYTAGGSAVSAVLFLRRHFSSRADFNMLHLQSKYERY